MKMMRLRYHNEMIAIGKILGIGRNYADHAKEMKSDIPDVPIIFLMPSTAVIQNGDPIVFPRFSNEMHHEAEIIIAIGKECKNVTVDQAHEAILGYGIGLDMTLRDLQNEAKKKGLPWSVAKGFDTSAPISEIIPKERIGSERDLRLRCSVNGVVRQEGSIAEMIFSPEQIISFASSVFTLERGDLIFTGTPKGVGEVKPGDSIEAELVGHVRISHPVISG